MDIPSACDHCLSRLRGTEVHSSGELDPDPDEWDVRIKDIQESAREGCEICRIHLNAIVNEEKMDSDVLATHNPAGSPDVVISHNWVARGDSTEVNDLTRLMVSGELFTIFTYSDDPASKYITNRRCKPEKSGLATLSRIQQWINNCIAGHGRESSRCGGSAPAELPPRVLEIFRSPDHTLMAKLIEPKRECAQYVALSYCWGPEVWNPLTTKESNYEQHCAALPIEKAAQTIQDAITTTESLGLRYLWVDALCIIQDSDSDKDFQISKMRSIFENAFITLVAAYGENASCGFLPMPPPAGEVAFKLPYEDHELEDGKEGTMYALRDDTTIEMQDQAINLRAWTLEERLLSRRKIIYFADRVSWECFEISLADMEEIKNMRDDLRLPPPILYPGRNPFTSDELMWTVHTEWTKNIEWYTCRELTKPGDKLRAIGGIAQKYQHVLNVEYIAGLWAGYVLSGLLWRRIVDVDRDSLRARPSQYRAPSWSWAAVDGKIEYDWPEREEGSLEVARLGLQAGIATTIKPTILDQMVKLKHPGRPFGGVAGGSLTIRGMVRSVQVALQAGIHEDFGRTLQAQLNESRRAAGKHNCRVFIDIWPDATGDLLTGDTDISLLCLTGAAEDTRANKKYAHDMIFVVRGLAIAHIEGNIYSRKGFFELRHDGDYDSLLRCFYQRELQLI